MSTASDARNAAYAATILRLASGGLFIAHALIKIFVFTLPGTVGFSRRSAFRAFLPISSSRLNLAAVF